MVTKDKEVISDCDCAYVLEALRNLEETVLKGFKELGIGQHQLGKFVEAVGDDVDEAKKHADQAKKHADQAKKYARKADMNTRPPVWSPKNEK